MSYHVARPYGPRVSKPPSDAQIRLLAKLMGGDAEAEQYIASTKPTRSEVSRCIDRLLNQQREIRQQVDEVDETQVEPGYYQHGDQVYVVVQSKSNPDRTYAKALRYHASKDGKWLARWEYHRGAVYGLRGIIPLSIEEAKRLGHLHGICVICARQLTTPKSVEQGIGPVCAKRLIGRGAVAA